MQTFLPHKEYWRSAACLDNKRLGKQRVEVLQILKTLAGLSQGWRNHPAVKMWRGHELQLAFYGVCICAEWRRRGFRDSCGEKITQMASRFQDDSFDMPSWLDEDFCQRHRSALLKKDPEHYRQYWPSEPDDLDYIWPV